MSDSITYKRIDRNPEGKALYVFDCTVCGNEIRYLRWKLNRGVSFTCVRCASRARPPPPHYKEPFKALFTHFILGCKRRNVPVSLTFEQFRTIAESGAVCNYCGTPVQWSAYSSSTRKWSTATNLDRKDNRLGYSVENCVVCCWICNRIKCNHLTHDEMTVAMKAVLKLRKSTPQPTVRRSKKK